MQHKLSVLGRFTSCLGGIVTMVLVIGSGCDSTGTGGATWTQQGGQGVERWTINCLRSSAPNHAELCNGLAEYLRKAPGLDSRLVRIQSDGLGSTICYGEYTRVAGADGQLVFPPKVKQDIDRICGLTYNQTRPFAFASPEMIGAQAGSGRQGEYNVTTARGKYVLLIAVFYNTPTFNQRREVAEQYLQQLRGEGVEAYIFHELVKSYVFVGSFGADALTPLPDGTWQVSKEVLDFAAARPGEEFKYLMENLYRQKHVAPDGQSMFAPSQLMPVPRPGAQSLYDR